MLQKNLLGFPAHKFKNLKAPYLNLFVHLLHHGGDFDLSALPVMSKSQARYWQDTVLFLKPWQSIPTKV